MVRDAKKDADEAAEKGSDAMGGFFDEVGKFGDNLRKSGSDWLDSVLSKAERDIEERRKAGGERGTDDEDKGNWGL